MGEGVMKQFTINIFGSEWTVRIGTHDELPSMGYDARGFTDLTVREIGVEEIGREGERGRLKNMSERMKETLRHEIAHAALIECSLLDNRDFNHEQIADWVCTKHHALHAIIVDAESKFDQVMQ
jgi:hypothetical protein